MHTRTHAWNGENGTSKQNNQKRTTDHNQRPATPQGCTHNVYARNRQVVHRPSSREGLSPTACPPFLPPVDAPETTFPLAAPFLPRPFPHHPSLWCPDCECFGLCLWAWLVCGPLASMKVSQRTPPSASWTRGSPVVAHALPLAFGLRCSYTAESWHQRPPL